MDEAVAAHVYVGNFGTYAIPSGVYAEAVALSGAQLSDQRTKGARLLKQWGRDRDAQEGRLHKTGSQ